MTAYKAGEAWDAAKKLIDKPQVTEEDLLEAERLCEHMVLSDARLMLNRIQAKRELLFR